MGGQDGRLVISVHSYSDTGLSLDRGGLSLLMRDGSMATSCHREGKKNHSPALFTSPACRFLAVGSGECENPHIPAWLCREDLQATTRTGSRRRFDFAI